MANRKLVDVSTLMRQPSASRPAALPGVHARRVGEQPAIEPPAAEEPVTAEADPETDTSKPEHPEPPAEKTEAEEGPAADPEPEPVVEAKAKASRGRSTAKKAPTPRKRGSASTKKSAAPESSKSEKPGAEKESPEPEELVSLDGRPARLWDISDGKELPEGWARIALERVQKASRHFRSGRRNTTLPDNIYSACNDFIYQEGRRGGLDLTLSNLAEAAYEQIPNDDQAGIERLLDSLPDSYFEKGLQTRPRTFMLYEPTMAHMENLARMLRALGFTGKTGLVQTAALRQLLLDLDVTIAE